MVRIAAAVIALAASVVGLAAHGSEEIAVRALEYGAASYVPKSQLAHKLRETVSSVLAMARADRSLGRLMDSLTESQSRFELPSDPALFPPLVDYLQHRVTVLKSWDEVERVRIGVAVEEALRNAFYHGNLELSYEQLESDSGPDLVARRLAEPPYRDRKIDVLADFSRLQLRIVISDEGRGYDYRGVASSDKSQLLAGDAGRGLLLMRSFMDEVTYNDRGNEVTLVKRAPAQLPES